MTNAATSTFRLPGVSFLPARRERERGLPRLDVAAFVGFAQRGPLHTPVPLEDFSVYDAIFGGELPLAQEEDGRLIHAYLRRTVAAFFANGGGRCYVVRVAGDRAKRTRFPVPGVVALDSQGAPRQGAVFASSEGRWSRDLELATALSIRRLPPGDFELAAPGQLRWCSRDGATLRAGDLLRLTLTDGARWLFPITHVERASEFAREALLSAGPSTVPAGRTWRLETVEVHAGKPLRAAARLAFDSLEPLALTVESTQRDAQPFLEIGGADAGRLRRGDALQLEFKSGATYLINVTETLDFPNQSPPTSLAFAPATDAIVLPAVPLPGGAKLRQVERLGMDLALADRPNRPARISELAWNAQHPRFWGVMGSLESGSRPRGFRSQFDADSAAASVRLLREVLTDHRSGSRPDDKILSELFSILLTPLWDEKRTYLPLGMPSTISDQDFVGPAAADVGDDDLEEFSSLKFLDPSLVPNPDLQSSPAVLESDAFDRLYRQDRRLHGVHSLLPVDEVALVSAPDAVHRGWGRSKKVSAGG